MTGIFAAGADGRPEALTPVFETPEALLADYADRGKTLCANRYGFGQRIWQSRVETDRVVFSLFSPDGDQGYPGDLNAEVVYDWSDDCELEITYYAKTTAPTIINLTNHSYFNLKGEDRPGAMDQLLQING